MSLNCDRDALCFSCDKERQKYITGLCEACHKIACKADDDAEAEALVSISPETHEAVAQEVKKCHEVLQTLIDDFDQTGCSFDMGTVMLKNINAARGLLGMEIIPPDGGFIDDDMGCNHE